MDDLNDRNAKKVLPLHQRKLLSKKCSAEDTSFPCPDNVLPTKILLDEEEVPESTPQSFDQSYPTSLSLPIPTKLVSAMKGSRAEQGRIFEKMGVKWASDVYDPPQTSLSHTVNRKKQKKKVKNKKKGKKAQTQNNNNRQRKGCENKTQMEKQVVFEEFNKCSRTALVSC